MELSSIAGWFISGKSHENMDDGHISGNHHILKTISWVKLNMNSKQPYFFEILV